MDSVNVSYSPMFYSCIALVVHTSLFILHAMFYLNVGDDRGDV